MCGLPLYAVESTAYHLAPRHVQELSKDELDEFLDFCVEKALGNPGEGDGLSLIIRLTVQVFNEC
jgi:hypothetical protein